MAVDTSQQAYQRFMASAMFAPGQSPPSYEEWAQQENAAETQRQGTQGGQSSVNGMQGGLNGGLTNINAGDGNTISSLMSQNGGSTTGSQVPGVMMSGQTTNTNANNGIISDNFKTQPAYNGNFTNTISNLGNLLNSPTNQTTNQSTNANAGGSDPISGLYQNLLGRAPDAAGLQYWQQQLNSGKSLQDISNAFMKTPEYQQRQQANIVPNPSTQAGTNPYGITTSNQFAASTNPYVQAAQQTSLANLAGAQTATAANRVNQSTPYSNLQYKQTGVDAQGNPIWSANQSLNPALQGTMNNLTGNLAASTANPFSVSNYQNKMVGQGPGFTNVGAAPNLQTKVGGTGMEGWDAATGLLMQRLQPQIDRSNAALDNQLANQGIMPGSEAYKNAKQQQAQSNNDLLTQAQLAGSQVQNTMFKQNVDAGTFTNQALTGQNTMNLGNTQFNNLTGQQGYANQLAGTQANNAALQNNYKQNYDAYNLPLTQLGAFNQATQPGYVNPANQAATTGPDYAGAYATSQAAAIAAQNAANAKTANTQNGLYSLGGAALLGGGLNTLGNGLVSAYNYFNPASYTSATDYMNTAGINPGTFTGSDFTMPF